MQQELTSSRYISTNTLMGLRPKSLSEGTNTCVDTGRTYIWFKEPQIDNYESLQWLSQGGNRRSLR
jgi:hypothetical protein